MLLVMTSLMMVLLFFILMYSEVVEGRFRKISCCAFRTPIIDDASFWPSRMIKMSRTLDEGKKLTLTNETFLIDLLSSFFFDFVKVQAPSSLYILLGLI